MTLLAIVIAGGVVVAIIHAVSPTNARRVDAASALEGHVGSNAEHAGPGAGGGRDAAGSRNAAANKGSAGVDDRTGAVDEVVEAAAARARAIAIARGHLASPSPRVQRSAALALARACDAEAIALLAASLATEPSAIARIAIADALARCGDARGTDVLLAAQADARRDVRADAAKALSLRGDPRGEPFLRRLLRLPSHRLGAAEVLALRADPAALALLTKVHADPAASADDRTRAVIALAAAGDADALVHARAALDELRFRPAAAAALARAGDAAARPALVDTLAIASLRIDAALGLRRLEPALDPTPLLPVLLDAAARERDVDQPSACEAILILTAPATPAPAAAPAPELR